MSSDAVVALLVTFAVAASTWSAYQSARWSGLQARSFAEASASRTQASQATSISNARVTIDVGLFTQWVTAEVNGDRALTAELEARFPQSLKQAFAAWQAGGGLESAIAPRSPFEMAEYLLPEIATIQELESEAAIEFDSALESNQRSDNYVLMTVFFSLLIVVVSVGTKLSGVIKIASVLLCTLGLLGGLAVLLRFPIH